MSTEIMNSSILPEGYIEWKNIIEKRIESAGLCHFSLKIFSNELLHSSFLFCNFVLSSN